MQQISTLDINAMLRAAAAPLVWWIGMVVVVAVGGYPGVACVTPLAWILACWTGNNCAARSRSPARQRLLEAAIAGAIVGFGQGVLFYVVLNVVMPLGAGERASAAAISAVVLVAGMIAGALLSMATAAMRNRRREAGG